MRKEWWQTFFRPSYFPIDELVPADQTAVEVRALKRLLPPAPARILDVACGTGRHAVALGRLGYDVTGADQSAPYLAAARKRSARSRAKAVFVKRDMRRLGFDSAFDVVVNLWTSFGYFRTASQDVAALRSMRRALRPGGRLILEIVDGDHVRDHLLRRNWSPAGRGWMLEENRWRDGKDPAVLTERTYVAPDGSARTCPTFVRHYDAPRLRRSLESAGFRNVRVRAGLLEPGAPAGLRKRLLVIGWKGYETRRMRP